MAHAYFEPGHALHDDVPLSCGGAWIKYSQEVDVLGTDSADMMQAAFDAGWLAALAALRAQNQ